MKRSAASAEIQHPGPANSRTKAPESASIGEVYEFAADSAEPPTFSGCVIGWDWTRPAHVLYDARYVKRATAIGATASEYCIDFKDARCTVEYARWLTRQEIWDSGAGERWWHDQGHFENGKWVVHDDRWPDAPPPEPVDDWNPDPERDAVFELCGRDAPGAVKVWKVETGL